MTTTECVHHWIIETATGPASKGVCCFCGEEREFNNSIGFQTSTWTRRSPVVPQPEEADDDG